VKAITGKSWLSESFKKGIAVGRIKIIFISSRVLSLSTKRDLETARRVAKLTGKGLHF